MPQSELPGKVCKWFAAPNFGQLATIEPDGQPHLSTVWVMVEKGDILFSTTKEKRKYLNLTRNPRATILVPKPDDPYGYCEVRHEAGHRQNYPRADTRARLTAPAQGRGSAGQQ